MGKLKNFFRICGVFLVCILVSTVFFLIDPLIGIPLVPSLVLICAPWVGFVVVAFKMEAEEAKEKTDLEDEEVKHE